MFLDPRDYAPTEFLKKADAIGLSETAARRLLGAVIGKGDYDKQNWSNEGLIPKRLLANFTQLPALTLEEVTKSATDGFQKLLFKTAEGFPLETVIIPLHKEGSVTLCISSQVGCVMGCTFCATARMEKRRNLATWEIIDQFIQARRIVRESGRRVTGVVYMGMGEPFLNYDKVLAAAELMRFPIFDSISGDAITISTVGLVQEINRFTDEKRPFRLSISIGSAFDSKRAKLVPIAARTPIVKVIEAARRYALDRRERINIAYVCISNENVGEEDARELGRLIGDTPVRLDLIDVNDSTGTYLPPSNEEINLFRDALRKHVGQPVVRRYSGGSDIRAACGTLAGKSSV